MSFNSLQTGKRIQRRNHKCLTPPSLSSFNSLQTGKRIQSLIAQSGQNKRRICFNSLQTGKRIQSRCLLLWAAGAGRKFQFPSNGKAYSKKHRIRLSSKRSIVSIPFKRESVFKDGLLYFHKGVNARFNSLQTGKRIQRSLTRESLTQLEQGFNSLQTGKRIQSVSEVLTPQRQTLVSIPFKRESVFKVM